MDTDEMLTLKRAPTDYQRFISAIRSGVVEQTDLARGAEIQAILAGCAQSAKNAKFVSVATSAKCRA